MCIRDSNSTAQSLRPELEKTRKIISDLQEDGRNISALLSDVEGYNKRASAIASDLEDALDNMAGNLSGLESSLNNLEKALKNTKGISGLNQSDLLALLPAEDAAKMKTVLKYRSQYEDYLDANGLRCV